ncbi:MAG: DUF1016 family protein [Bacteroidales bacterium]|nr:DUF1016 family protein [Candidatus Scybalocola fimicaballi]
MASDNNIQFTDDLRQAVSDIKRAIVVSQSRALRMISGQQLSLYYGIGIYVSEHSRTANWGTGAIDAISEQLKKEMPGLRGFSSESIKKMRAFAEFWSQYINRSAVTTDLPSAENCSSLASKIQVDAFALAKWSPVTSEIHRDEFLGVSFSHHMEILHKTKDIQQVLAIIHQTVLHMWSTRQLREAIPVILKAEQPQVAINNFVATMPTTRQAVKAIDMFKDEYTLDFINVEDIAEDYESVDERVIEKEIVRNIKTFVMTFGRDFCYIGNQYSLETFGEEQFTDLLFFNRELNALVVIELKIGKFKPAYLGQLSNYMQILDDKIRKPHENPTIGIVLCKEMNRSFAEYAVRDYSKPMGVATYRTQDDMPEPLRKSLPNLDDMAKLL